MNEDELELLPGARTRAALSTAGEALTFLAGAVLLYRILNPDGPEPLELARDAWRDAFGWIREQRSYRKAMLETLARIRDLPETEGSS